MGANEGKHDWFEQQFGFVENEMDGFKEVQKSFQFDKSTNILSSRANMRKFSVGLFETPSVKELQDKLTETSPTNLGGLTFQNIVGDATDLHLDQENAGSVFQVASQFNCLEMVGPDVRPEDGITIYAEDGTQGPRCAMACPAATVFRNYLWEGRGQAGGNNKQVNTAEDLGRLLGNEDRKYWNMKNGYMMPSRSDAMKEVGERIFNEDGLRESLFLSGRIGIHWSTEVATGSHQVTQVFCSAVPITYTQTGRGTKPKDWKSLAEVILESAYEATLLTGAILAGKREQRVTVFLTCLGGGAFGNPSPWICAAMEKALLGHVDKPLDVKLVSYARMPTDTFVKLESKVKRSRRNN